MLVCAGLLACTNPQSSQYEDEAATIPAVAVETAALSSASGEWVNCAREGDFCRFTGRHKVRFGRNGRYHVRAASNGIQCTRRNFLANKAEFQGRPRCSFNTERLPPVPSPAVGVGGRGAASAGRTGGNTGRAAAGASGGATPIIGGSGAHQPGHSVGSGSAPAGHATAGTSASNPGSMHASGATIGPTINVNAIPRGDSGVSDVRIRGTSERPVRSDGTGAFRTSCNFSHMNFDDPIVFPGKPGASHLHAYFGNTAVNAASTAESIRNSGNSTCRGGISNRSGYWVPALLDAAGVPQKPLQGQIYYKTGYHGVPPQKVVAFPAGLRMIAGDAKAKAPQRVAYWRCEDDFNGHSDSFPNCGSKPIVMVVEFPQCWDGVNLDSADHKSHMAYANGGCPSTHPIPLPVITFNIPYRVPPFTGTMGWRLVSDAYDRSLPGGFSAHADWFDGWDQSVVAEWIQHCDNAAVDCHSHLLGNGREIFY